MQRDDYKFIELLKGSFDIYQENEKLMNFLKFLCKKDREIEDFYFYLIKNEHNLPEIRFKVIRNMKTLKGVIIEIKKRLGIVDNETIGYVEFLNNAYQLYGSKSVSIINCARNDFNDIVPAILASSFANRIKFGKSYLHNGSISILPNSIELNVFSNIVKDNVRLAYDARSDEIISYCSYFSDEIIEELMSTPIPSNILSIFHNDLIEESVREHGEECLTKKIRQGG